MTWAIEYLERHPEVKVAWWGSKVLGGGTGGTVGAGIGAVAGGLGGAAAGAALDEDHPFEGALLGAGMGAAGLGYAGMKGGYRVGTKAYDKSLDYVAAHGVPGTQQHAGGVHLPPAAPAPAAPTVSHTPALPQALPPTPPPVRRPAPIPLMGVPQPGLAAAPVTRYTNGPRSP